MPSPSSRIPAYAVVFLGGMAALSWEMLWQHYASLSLGVSALGTAITLAVTMAGMTAGSLIAGHLLSRRPSDRPLLWYGMLEVSVGLIGQLLEPAFGALSAFDTQMYQSTPGAAPMLHLLAIAAVIGPAAAAMGATIPLFGLIAARTGSSLARLYGMNTAGAAGGVLLIALVLLPVLGVSISASAVSFINLSAGLLAVLAASSMGRGSGAGASEPKPMLPAPVGYPGALAIAFLTGAVTFILEVAWFRSLRAAFWSYTDSFAVILFAVLISLAVAARIAVLLARRKLPLGAVLAAAGILVLLASPLIERADSLIPWPYDWSTRMLVWLACSVALLGPPMTLLATSLPWLLDTTDGARRWAGLYSANTAGAISGSLGAAWLILPSVGAVPASWLAGAALIVGALALGRVPRIATAVVGVAALSLSVYASSGAGRLRAQGRGLDKSRVIEVHEGPDSTSAVVERPDGARQLAIDGFVATADYAAAREYMTWMGVLPMFLSATPNRALVICFGTGLTANAVRSEAPGQLRIVELDPNVLAMAHHFAVNEGVLQDRRVQATVMDGRAWLRRTSERYDVVTLEPMPPNFAGVNSLYSVEFYRIAAHAMNEGGVIAQWLPFHLLTLDDSVAITAAFHAVFPESILWVSPGPAAHGILLGRKGPATGTLGLSWPGVGRPNALRPPAVTEARLRAGVRLTPSALGVYAESGVPVTDDNQRLSYGRERLSRHEAWEDLAIEENLAFVDRIAQIVKATSLAASQPRRRRPRWIWRPARTATTAGVRPSLQQQ